MRKMKGGMILLNVNKIFKILLLQTEKTYLPSFIKVVLISDISSQHKINVGLLRVINTYYVLDTRPITINLFRGSQLFMEVFAWVFCDYTAPWFKWILWACIFYRSTFFYFIYIMPSRLDCNYWTAWTVNTNVCMHCSIQLCIIKQYLILHSMNIKIMQP